MPLEACQQALGLLQGCLLRHTGNASSGEGEACPEAAMAAALDLLKLSMQAWPTHPLFFWGGEGGGGGGNFYI